MTRQITFLVAAVIVSPILGAFLGYMIGDLSLLMIMDLASWAHNFQSFVASNFATTILGTFISVPFVLFYGVPVFYLLRKLKLQNVWMFGLFGLLPTTIGTLLSWSRGEHAFELMYMTMIFRWAMAGCLTACCFWFIAVYLPSRSNGAGRRRGA